MALLEAAMGPGLLWPRVRPFFRWLVVAFHALVVLSLWKLQWNLVVIPWNLTMAVLVWLVFAGREAPVWPRRIGAAGLVMLAGLMPVLNIFHAWPEALSWKMYSNTQPEMTIYTHGGPPCPELSGLWPRLAFDRGTKMTVDDWAIDRMGVPPVAGDWIFLPLGRYICRCAAPADSAGIYILNVERWDRGAERLEKIPCELFLGRSD
jgi:hypothetical protein